jgi:hypothetical protein
MHASNFKASWNYFNMNIEITYETKPKKWGGTPYNTNVNQMY